MGPAEIIRTLHLQPHPEGGWYAETWRAEVGGEPPVTRHSGDAALPGDAALRGDAALANDAAQPHAL